MEKFLENYFSEDNENLHQFVRKDYGILFQISGFYRRMDTVKEKCFTTSYVFLIITMLTYQAILFLITMFHTDNDLIIMFQTFHYFVLTFLSMHWLFFMFVNREKVARIFKAIHHGLYTYDEEREIYREKVKNANQFYRKLTIKYPPINCIAASIFAEIGPLIDRCIRNIQYETYSPGGLSQNIPIPTWIPYGTDTNFKLIFTIFIKLVFDFYVGLIFGTCLTIIFGSSNMVRTETELLIHSLNHQPSRTENLFNKTASNRRKINITKLREDKEMASCYKRNLRDNAIHYQRIISLFLDVQNVLSVPMFFTFICSSVILALSASAVVFGKGQVGLITSVVGIFITESMALLIICWFAERVRQSSENLREALYATDWIYAHKDAAIYIQIMSSRALKPLTLTSFGLLPITFETFANIMNTGYSYFNLIYATNSE
uniref:Odorant receptor n=2 Tax=Rhodnius prolixus TaxID=13249 RepID=T1H8S1_RHOPR